MKEAPLAEMTEEKAAEIVQCETVEPTTVEAENTEVTGAQEETVEAVQTETEDAEESVEITATVEGVQTEETAEKPEIMKEVVESVQDESDVVVAIEEASTADDEVAVETAETESINNMQEELTELNEVVQAEAEVVEEGEALSTDIEDIDDTQQIPVADVSNDEEETEQETLPAVVHTEVVVVPEETALAQPSLKDNIKKNRAFQIAVAVIAVLIAVIGFMMMSGGQSNMTVNEPTAAEAAFESELQTLKMELKTHHGNLEQVLANISSDNRKDSAAKLTEMQTAIEQLRGKVSALQAPGQEQEHAKERLLKILDHEKILLVALQGICNDPLNANTEARIIEITKMIREVNSMVDGQESIKTNVDNVSDKMRAMAEKERKLGAKRAEMRRFVEALDPLVWKYNQQDSTMDDLVDKAESKHFKYGKQTSRVGHLKNERQALLMAVQRLNVPKDAQGMVRHLEAAIKSSINCCNTMTKMFNEELTYDERKALFKQVQSINRDEGHEHYLFWTKYDRYKQEI